MIAKLLITAALFVLAEVIFGGGLITSFAGLGAEAGGGLLSAGAGDIAGASGALESLLPRIFFFIIDLAIYYLLATILVAVFGRK